LSTEATPDLRALCRAVHPLVLAGGISTASSRRRVEPLGFATRDLVGFTPLPVHGYVDGIQATRLLTWRPAGRPVYLAAVAAGVMATASNRISGFKHRLVLMCSYLDASWAGSLPGHCPVVLLAAHHGGGIDQDAARWVDTARRDCERAALISSLEQTLDWTVLDGSLRDLDPATVGHAPQVIGAVKTCNTQYLMDEHLHVHDLPEGAISPAFRLPAEHRSQLDRVSCYLRQRDATGRAWTHGLVRVELPTAHADLLPLAAAALLAGRQPAGTGDPRWDRQQLGVALLERGLRARLPHLLLD
jgi:hypothetical protein